MAEGVRRREPVAARVLHRGGDPGEEKSINEWSGVVEERIRMLLEERIELKLAGEGAVAEEADSAGAEEEHPRAAPRWMKLQIN